MGKGGGEGPRNNFGRVGIRREITLRVETTRWIMRGIGGGVISRGAGEGGRNGYRCGILRRGHSST